MKLKVKSAIKAGGIRLSNHSRADLKVKAGVKARGIRLSNHSRACLFVTA